MLTCVILEDIILKKKKKKKKKTSMDQFSKALKKFHQKPLNSKNLQRAWRTLKKLEEQQIQTIATDWLWRLFYLSSNQSEEDFLFELRLWEYRIKWFIFSKRIKIKNCTHSFYKYKFISMKHFPIVWFSIWEFWVCVYTIFH